MMCRRRAERLAVRNSLKSNPEAVVPRLNPITHREGSPTLAPAIQVSAPCQLTALGALPLLGYAVLARLLQHA